MKAPKMLACVILAGGKSSRMQQDKSLLPFGGYPTLCQYQYERMKKIFKHVYISVKEPSKYGFTADFIVEENEAFAPTYGLKKVLETIREEACFVMAVDMPFLSESVIHTVVERYDPSFDAVIVRENGTVHTLCGIYSRSIQPKIDEAVRTDRHKLQRLLEEVHTCYVDIDDADAFVNLNYPHEYDEAVKR